MLNKLIFICITLLLLMAGQSNGQTKKNILNYLGVKGPVSIQKNVYNLVWSSHPEASFYKQEYLPDGDAFPNYKSMFTIDFAVTESSVDDAVNRKILELKQLKKTGLDVNYEVIANPATGEKMIDCLIGQTAVDEQKSLIERDVYRFKSVKTKSGERGLLLIAVSDRKYGKDIKPFLINLKTSKPLLANAVAKFPMPELTLSK